jgi:hypothetical protein
MIQRKQTIWLGLIFILCFFSVWVNVPFREVKGKLDGKLIEDVFAQIGFSYTSIEIAKVREKKQENTFLKYSTILLGINSLICIFLFKQRNRQLLLVKLNFALILMLAVFMAYYGWGQRYVDLEPDPQIIISIIFPFLFFWFNLKAFQGIKKDEDLVKSYDRIR